MNDRTFNHQLLIKWLFLLLCFHVASFAVTALDYLPIPNLLIDWSEIILAAGVILCLFRIAPVNRRYRVTVVCRTILLVRTVFYALMPATALFTLYQMKYYSVIANVIGFVAVVLSWMATYQEYRAHGELIAEQAPKLSKNWIILFACNIGFALLGSVVSMTVGHFYETLHLEIGVINAVYYVVRFGNHLFTIIYLWFLYKTILKIKK